MKISLNKNVIIKDYETKGLLIDVERADYRKVNSSGLTISKFLNKYGEISVEELLLKLSDLYELPEEVFGEEVQQFLDDMIEKGFFVKDGDYSRIETEETICHQTSNITEIMEKSKQKYGEIDVEMLSKCKNCEIKYYCGGGCRAIAFNETGDLYGQERNCDNYRNRVFDLMLQ